MKVDETFNGQFNEILAAVLGTAGLSGHCPCGGAPRRVPVSFLTLLLFFA